MQTSIQIIEEIETEAASIQRKLLTLPGPGEDVNEKQQDVINATQKSLMGWRSWDLGELKKAFSG